MPLPHTRLYRSVPLLLLASTLLPAGARAQRPAQRAEFTALRDSLAAVEDSTGLLALERRTIVVAKQHRDNPAIHVRLAMIAQRLGQLGASADHFNDAGSEGEWATELAQDWPWAWYVLGRANLALREMPPTAVVGTNRLRKVLNVDETSEALKDFQHAVALDPTFAPALRGLVDAALDEQSAGHQREALAAVREAAARGSAESPELLLARAEIERQLGDPDSALAAYRRYRARGGDEALALLEEAKTLFLLQQPVAARTIYDSAADRLGSDTSVADMRQDLAWIADSAELKAYDALRPGEYGGWIRKFWQRRDLADARQSGERLTEHYRRLFYVLQHFRRAGAYREVDLVFRYHSGQQWVDDRGVVYMRHGPPDDVATYTNIGVPPNISWLYHRPGGDIILHFSTGTGARDYRLIESLADLYGFETAHWLQTGAFTSSELPRAGCTGVIGGGCDQFAAVRPVFESRSSLDPIYDRIASSGDLGARATLTQERSMGQAGIAVATTTDDDLLRFKQRLPASVQRFGIGTGQGGRILVVLGVRAGDLVPVQQAGGHTAYPLGIRIYAEAAGGQVRLIDTSATFATATPYPPDRLLSWTTAIPATPGDARLTVALAVAASQAGIARRWDSVPVPDLAAGRLTMSDLVTGRREMGVQYPAGRDTLVLNPLDSWPTGGNMTVYYQLGGLRPGSGYRTSIEVVQLHQGVISKLLGSAPRAIRVSFDEPATGPTARVTRTVKLAGLSPGAYRLIVTVTGPGGEDIRRTTDFEVSH